MDIFKETLTKEDCLDIPPIKIDLVQGHQNIQTFKPKTPIEVSPYMEQAAKKKLSRMVEAGMIEEIDYYTEHLSRGFFVEKPGKSEVQARLVADFRSVNKKIRRPEIPLEGSWNILRRLDPNDSYFACVDFSSGFSQLTLDESSRDLFNIILQWGKFRYCVLHKERVQVQRSLTSIHPHTTETKREYIRTQMTC